VITQVRLSQFRCFDTLDVHPGPQRTYVVGKNAQGKTSILEAICVLLRLQSPRTSTVTDLIKSNTNGFAIEGIFNDTRLSYRHTGEGRQISLDSKLQPKSADYLAVARVTWFANTDLELVKGSGSLRRRYLDFLGVQSVPGYKKALSNYERTQRSRNALLKEGRPRREIAAFDSSLIENGELLMEARAELCASLGPLARTSCEEISGQADNLEIRYRPGCNGPFADALAASRDEEDRLRQTVCGPHRDDIDVTLNGLKASAFASEGQQRSIALALKIAQARHIENLHDRPPLLLLDDIFGELDTERRNRLLTALPSQAQAVITTTFLDWVDNTASDAVFLLADGRLTSRK
jgi:DNA replication and repair protein RecF